MATQATQEIQQLSAELGQLTRVLRDMVGASSRTIAAQQANRQAFLDQTEQMEDFSKQLVQGKALTKQQQELAKQAIALKKAELQLAKRYADAQRDADKITKSAIRTDEEKARAQHNATKALERWQAAQTATSTAASAVTSSLGGLVKGTNIAAAAVTWFGATLKTAISHAKDQIVANQGMVEGTGGLLSALKDQQDQALAFGMSGADFAKVVTANRQVVNAMGGTAESVKQVQSSMDSFYAMTGSNSAAFQALTESMSSFAAKGIKPTQSVLEAYTKDVKTLAMQTGMNEAQAREFYDNMAGDVESIDLLRSARKEERAAILQSQRALVQQAIATGMSAEQAKEAAKMLNKMVAAKPLDRLKQAAKIRALSGAMGIAGGEEAAQAVMAGKRATAEQKQALMKFSENAANTMDQAAGQGLGSEIFATQLMDKLDLDQYYGKGSPFSTTMGDTLAKPLADLQASYVDASQSSLLQTGRQVDLIIEQVKSIISGTNYLGLIAAGVTAIGATLIGGKLISGIGSVVTNALQTGKNFLGVGAKAAGAGAGTAAGAAQVAGKAATATVGATAAGTTAASQVAGKAAGATSTLGKIGSVAKGAGIAGSVLDVGLGVKDLINGKRQTEMPSGWDAISPMRWGMYAGEKVNGLAEKVVGPGGIGGALYDQFNPSAPQQQVQPPKAKERQDPVLDAAKKTADSTGEIKKATIDTSLGVTSQLKKMDDSHGVLKRIADLSEKQIDLAERQLAAMTMTEQERTSSAAKTALRSDTKFTSQYNSV